MMFPEEEKQEDGGDEDAESENGRHDDLGHHFHVSGQRFCSGVGGRERAPNQSRSLQHRRLRVFIVSGSANREWQRLPKGCRKPSLCSPTFFILGERGGR